MNVPKKPKPFVCPDLPASKKKRDRLIETASQGHNAPRSAQPQYPRGGMRGQPQKIC